jgi:hypothetical protein
MTTKVIKLSAQLRKILYELEEENDWISFELNYIHDDPYFSGAGKGITEIDVSDDDYSFLVTHSGSQYSMSIGRLIEHFFPKKFTMEEKMKFGKGYKRVKNELKGGEKKGKFPKWGSQTTGSTWGQRDYGSGWSSGYSSGGWSSGYSSGYSSDKYGGYQQPVYTPPKGDKIVVPDFKYNPKDPRSTFLSLITKTYPHGNEEEVLKFLPDLEVDPFGNYYKIIGNSTTMFTSHLDTADSQQKTTNLLTRKVEGDEIIYTDGNSILGADDKAGVTIMLYMMAHGVPGLYYFFIGEEVGRIGSQALSVGFDKVKHMEKIQKCISFDRRRTHSIITKQSSRICCSDQFAEELSKQLGKSGLRYELDPTGMYTDSASFMSQIPECTNISVGYENEHTSREQQNMTFLTKLCQACIEVDWENLPIARKIGLNQELIKKHSRLISEIKSTNFPVEVKMTSWEEHIYISCDFSDFTIDMMFETLTLLRDILKRNGHGDRLSMVDTKIKIELL